MVPTPHPRLPIPVKRILAQMGEDIREARLRRRIPTALLAERASISRTTLGKVETGDAGVSIGNYAAVLFSLGLLDQLGAVADPRNDSVGLTLESEELPKRIRPSRRNTYKSGDES